MVKFAVPKKTLFIIGTIFVFIILGYFGFLIFVNPQIQSTQEQNISFPSSTEYTGSVNLTKTSVITYGVFQGIVKSINKKDGIEYAVVEYVGNDKTLNTVNVFLNVDSSSTIFSSILAYAKKYPTLDEFAKNHLYSVRFQDSMAEYMDGNNTQFWFWDSSEINKYLTPSTGILVGYVSSFPDDIITSDELCSLSPEQCLIVRSSFEINHNIYKFWSGDQLDESDYIFPLFISTKIIL